MGKTLRSLRRRHRLAKPRHFDDVDVDQGMIRTRMEMKCFNGGERGHGRDGRMSPVATQGSGLDGLLGISSKPNFHLFVVL
jgi:hypothetical protein